MHSGVDAERVWHCAAVVHAPHEPSAWQIGAPAPVQRRSAVCADGEPTLQAAQVPPLQYGVVPLQSALLRHCTHWDDRLRRLVDDQRPFYRLLPALLALRLSLYFFTFVFCRMTAGGEPGFFATLEKLWGRWDGHHYIHIAEHGYASSGELANEIAFFPLRC